MSDYRAPIEDYQFIFDNLKILDPIKRLPSFEDISTDDVMVLLTEAAKFIENEIAPLNHSGDQEGAKINDHKVTTPKGFKEAYQKYVDAGWPTLPFDEEWGGQGQSWTITAPIFEMLHSANMAWTLCPLLTVGAIDAVKSHGSPELQEVYLRNLIAGRWTGTMNLTEPQAGSDLALLKTSSSAQQKDGTYLIKGQKIFITYGEHDMAENIIHLVLARLPNAPEGTRGISLFLVPKFIPNPDGTLGQANDVKAISIEHKLGINASPTCVMSYGEDNGGAIGWLVGEENKGLACMFTMMNSARLQVGLEGLGLIEKAYQQAVTFARERRQGKLANQSETVPIIEHPDVKRMLLNIRCNGEAMRALYCETMNFFDIAQRHDDKNWQQYAQRRVDLMTPVIKSWFTDQSVALSSEALQVFGGMGFIEETGIAQTFRDSRILPIYEGTNGIQAADLIGRKIIRDDGLALSEYIEEIHSLILRLNNINDDSMSLMRKYLASAVDALEIGLDWILSTNSKNDDAPMLLGATSTVYLKIFAIVAGGALMARSLMVALTLKAEGDDRKILDEKIVTAEFYATYMLAQVPSLLNISKDSPLAVQSMKSDYF